jgi:valyl-tRNA synthetase
MAEEASSLATRYDPKPVEAKWYSHWESRGYFHARPKADGAPFCIVIPPPNVTSALHMGHALNVTIQDILIRWRRMQGRNALWMPGTDHAGIATQNVVEKELAKKSLRRQGLGREKFLERVWQWREEYGSRIIVQLKKVGCSCDWERIRFTMDEGLSRAVREAFVTLYERGLIYRGKRLINWCPRCCTALSDDEVEHREEQGFLWFIRYPLKGEPRLHVTVATTRPETMLGDAAVAVNPRDERFGELIGQSLVLPIVEREIPVIADDAVDPEFGTGAVKVTPAHDPADFEMGLRHNLAQINVMTEDGRMNENAGEYAGMDRFECRESLLEELREKKLLEATQPYAHSIGHCYRCHTVVEPYLSDQWFVRMRPLADAALAASGAEKVRFHPARWKRVYESWLENVRDWCISRQIWWGHRIPAWHCEKKHITVSRADPTECAECGSKNLRRDEDVLDTWFSSSLWPFSTLGWPADDPMLSRFYPTSVLVTDRSIIYFWVARMVMMGLQMMGEVPFDDVYIHGTILDDQGRKMSKSLGNGVDPLDIVEQYGADAMRFTLVILTVEGQDVKFSADKFEMGRNFANKIWNASRFSLMNLAGGRGAPVEVWANLELEDRWILIRLNDLVKAATGALERFQFNEAAREIYEFTWNDFCDWYLEIIKPRLTETSTPSPVRTVLAHVLDTALRLLHPFMPHLSEEVWQLLRARMAQRDLDWAGARFPETIMLASWPAVEFTNTLVEVGDTDDEVKITFQFLQNIICSLRNIRSKLGIPERKPLDVALSVRSIPNDIKDADFVPKLRRHERILKQLGYIERIEIGVDLEKPAGSATDVVGRIQVFVRLKGVLDIDEERDRLQKKIEQKENYVAGLLRKLSEPNFLERAPAQVVAREKARCRELEEEVAKLRASLAELEEEA